MYGGGEVFDGVEGVGSWGVGIEDGWGVREEG